MHSYFLSLAEWAWDYQFLGQVLLDQGRSVLSKRWQGQSVEAKPEMVPLELQNVTLEVKIPETDGQLREWLKPSLPWAEEHFQERICGEPLNPPPSHVRWPYARKDNDEHTEEGRFSHTYPERFWPKHAGHTQCTEYCGDTFGIRYHYGDLQDVVNMMVEDPMTRQAYLPVFFPEDTGATEGQRIPCTLGYLFQIREDRMHITYHIRSCDFLRHFTDDVYMGMRLAQWMREAVQEQGQEGMSMGNLTMCIGSLHVFAGDLPIMKMRGWAT
jgi:hypothetical protein